MLIALWHSFGGAGAKIAYSDNLDIESANTMSSGELFSTEVGIQAQGNLIFTTIGFMFGTSLGYAGEREKYSSIESGVADAHNRGFSLADPDDGDYFDVQVSCICVCYQYFEVSITSVTDISRSCVRLIPVQHHERPEQVCLNSRMWTTLW